MSVPAAAEGVKDEPGGGTALDYGAQGQIDAQRAQLTAAQTKSVSFRGFSEEDLDVLFPFMSIISFDSGDPIMRCGEKATWAGVLLAGELDAVLPDGTVIGTVVPGCERALSHSRHLPPDLRLHVRPICCSQYRHRRDVPLPWRQARLRHACHARRHGGRAKVFGV